MPELLEQLQHALSDHYHIERELGAGGMATVYLAHDLKHDRPVALKVLRQELAAAMGVERFQREIHIAAKLQHPNILPLLDSGEAGGLLYYAMPYIEGQSLRERLAREGALPVADAVRILRDVVDALTEAHSHGVVHRDIKPENIMLRGRHALVADFGVAKAVSEATDRQTLTTAGMALGTPAYMAPEQASADPHLDHRVDIYAVGAVAYELLTGRPVFMGTTPQMVLSAHVTEAPAPITKYRETVPRALEALVMRCLEKRPADRWQSAEELLPQLETLATPSGGITPTDTQPVERVSPRRSRAALAVRAGLVALAVVAVLAFQLLRAKPISVKVSDLTQVTNDPGVEFQPAISPDGNEVAYVAGPITGGHLFVRSVANAAGGAAIRLGDSAQDNAWFPSWSADGQSVRFLSCARSQSFFDSTGCKWDETGKFGGAVLAARFPDAQRPVGPLLVRSPDGASVAFPVEDTIFVASGGGGAVRRLMTGGSRLHSLAWSPDGTRIAYVSGNDAWLVGSNVLASTIGVVSVDGGAPLTIVGRDHVNVSPAWLDDRHLLFVSDRDGALGVYVIEVGPRGGRGEPRLVPGLSDPHSISYSTASKTLAYARFTVRQGIRSYPLERRAPISIRDGEAITSSTDVVENGERSPDGRWFLFSGNLRSHLDLYRMPLPGGHPVPLTSGPAGGENGRWSPDGRDVAFQTVAAVPQIMVMSAEGGTPVALTDGSGYAAFPAWSPSGLQIVFQDVRKGRAALWLRSRDRVGGPWHDAQPLTDFPCWWLDWSPDGRMVACMNPASMSLTLLSPPSGRVLRSDLLTLNHLSARGTPRFARDSRSVYVPAARQDGREGIWAIPLTGGPARLVVAFDDPVLTSPIPTFISVDDARIFLAVSDYESDIWVAKLRN